MISQHDTDQERLIQNILDLKKKKNAVIVAHNYQIGDVQDVADHVGDSFELAKIVKNLDTNMIVFCGVRFMAESAKILSPEKQILLPEDSALCPLAAMVSADELRQIKKEHPDAAIVSYVNTTAEVKAVSDITVTSSSSVRIIKNLENDEIIFVPDQNLAAYTQEQLPDKNIQAWDGFCITHVKITEEQMSRIKEDHPDALVAVHAECVKSVRDNADYVGSTAGILDFCRQHDKREIIIGTEKNMCHRIRKEVPNVKLIPIEDAICQNMNKISLMSVFEALDKEQFEITLSPEILMAARKPLDRMVSS